MIAGAGVVGLSVARRLLRRGARVCVVDPSALGGLGSRAAAGVAIPSVRLFQDPPLRAFVTHARAVLQQDLSGLPEGQLLRRGAGILRMAPDAATRLALEAHAGSHPDGVGRWVSREELITLEPWLVGTPLEGAFVSDEGFMVDTHAYITALLHDVVASGGEVMLGERVIEVTPGAASVGVRTSAGSLQCDRLVVAAGAWSGGFAGLPPIPVRPVRGQMLTLFHPRVRPSHILSGPTYLAPWRSGELVVGATEEDSGFVAECSVAGMLQLLAGCARVAPVLRDASFRACWAGLRAVTPNGQPLIGPHPGFERVLIATGHAGQGILSGAATGEAVVELMNGGHSDLAAPFLPARVIDRINAAPLKGSASHVRP